MRRAPWIILILSMTACAAVRTPPQGPTGDWLLFEFRLSPDDPVQRPTGTAFTLSLDGEGTASGEVACNRWRGRYSIAAGSLFVEEVARTRKACLIEDQASGRLEPVFLTRLESGGRLVATGDRLELEFADGLRWRFVRGAGEK